MSARIKKYWYSLRFRFTLSAVLLSLLIAISSIYAINVVDDAQTLTSENLRSQAKVSEKLQNIRVNLLEGYSFIDAFLLEPERTHLKDEAIKYIEKCILTIDELKSEKKVFHENELIHLSKLSSLFDSLHKEMNKLFNVRQNAILQYPSLSIGNDVMRPNRNDFIKAIGVAINELNDDSIIEENPPLYAEFITVRYLWSQMLSNFRLYLANRVGSFDIASLPMQEKSIETIYSQLVEELEKLKKYDADEELGFQASESLNLMIKSSVNWYEGFQQVRNINKNQDWRMDSKIMREEIVPLFGQVSDVLNQLETQLNIYNTENIGFLSKSSNTVIETFILISLLFLFFLAGIFISTQKLIFKPIGSVVNALKSQGTGKENSILPVSRSKETEELFNSFLEMSKRIQQRQDDLKHQALHDALTALPNRTLLYDRIEHNIQLCTRQNKTFTLILIDLDQFKDINDTLGHHVGDLVLIKIGLRLKKVLRGVDTISRLSGDEFAILLPETNESDAINVCKKIHQVMLDVFEVETIQIYVSLSIGIACYPNHGEEVSTLIQHADVAMYESKNNKLEYAVYDERNDKYSVQRLELINDLRLAIENDGLELHFQPLKNIRLDKVVGVECLLRWNHPGHGYMSPIEVIDLAEHTGLINPLTYWVVEKAVKHGESIHSKGFDLIISINISVFNLKDPDFINRVKNILSETTLNPNSIMFEITESAMMADPVHAINILMELNDFGIKIAIDDFGTGFSSLAYLKQLPANELKIDKSFVLGMQTNASDEVIVRSTIDLAHNLGLEVIAEGVENNEIYLKLDELGCDMAQGYLFSRPVNIDVLIENLLQKKI